LVEGTVDADPAHLGLVVGVVENWGRMAPGHADPVRVAGLGLDEGVEVRTHKHARPGLVISPQSRRVGGGVAGIVASTAGEHALPDADVCIVGHWPSCCIERAQGHTSLGGGVSPGGLDGTAPVAQIVGVVGEGIAGAVEGVVIAPPVLAVSPALAFGDALPGRVVLCEVVQGTIVDAGPVASLISIQTHCADLNAEVQAARRISKPGRVD
jgi:hypothetical protein